jgi:hypothetical protein
LTRTFCSLQEEQQLQPIVELSTEKPNTASNFVHVCPPRSLSQYLQEIGRAWRRGQASTAVLYYSKRDIASNLPGQILVLVLVIFGQKKTPVMNRRN